MSTIDDLGPIVDMLASGTYSVQRYPTAEYGPGGRKGAATSNNTPWAPGSFTLGQQRYNGTEVYEVTTAGASALSGGPTGRGADILDGTVHWKWIGPRLAAPFNITASVQPLSGADLDRMPEGERTRELRKLYTSTELKGLGANQEPDRVTIGGADYQVQQVESWNELANFWKVIVARAGRE